MTIRSALATFFGNGFVLLTAFLMLFALLGGPAVWLLGVALRAINAATGG